MYSLCLRLCHLSLKMTYCWMDITYSLISQHQHSCWRIWVLFFIAVSFSSHLTDHMHTFFLFFFLQSVCFFCISFDCCFTTVRFFYYSTRNTLQSCTPFLASSLETIAFLLVSCLRGSSFSFGTLALLFPCTMKQTCFLIQKNKGMSSCRLYTDCTSLLAQNILIYSGKSKIGRCCINLMVILCLYLFFCIG